jgi:hypothetical protein
MLDTVSSDVFSNSNYIGMTPVVSAEWNNNLYNAPYVTMSGDGSFDPTKLVVQTGTGLTTPSSVLSTSDYAKENFTTKSFAIPAGSDTTPSTVKYKYTDAFTSATSYSYKVVFYAKTDSLFPVTVNSNIDIIDGTAVISSAGSSEVIDSLTWTKFELLFNWHSHRNTGSFDIYISAFNNVSYSTSSNVYITLPEVYEISAFDYEYGSLWSTYSPFSFFRPGESYVTTGNADVAYPTNFRRVTNGLKSGQTYQDMPVSPLLYNPNFFLASPPVGIFKSGVANDIYPYQYFVSSLQTTKRKLTAKYERSVYSNKIVLKFNTIMSVPTVTVKLDGTSIGSFVPETNGTLVLYYNGSTWSKTRWDYSSMPKFTSSGSISPSYATFTKITLEQVLASTTINSEFSDSKYTSLADEFKRFQIIEVSPRLELDVSSLVKSISIRKSLDSQNTYMPISSINSNDANIVLSSIPFTSSSGDPIPIFSNESNITNNILKNMLRKNVKFYINYLLSEYKGDSFSTTDYHVPGGIFYSESWNEEDANAVNIQSYDISRYLQTTPVPDYVVKNKTVFEIITNILDLAGFTDYDYDSLYNICNDPSVPLDVAYYYCNSQDSTIINSLSELFLAYQIGAYIDEYGVMKFLSLNKILTNTTSDISITDSNILEGGYSFESGAKPGKISLRYQPPKIKQSLSLQNAKNFGASISPSFIYTTSNDVVWSQQNLDSVGFNYLNSNFLKTDKRFDLKINDLLDIFHTYSLNNDGYAIIENEIVSFLNKEYTLTTEGTGSTETVSVKSDIELGSEINRFIKKYVVGFRSVSATVSSVTVASGLATYTYTATNRFRVGDKVTISGVSPSTYNLSASVEQVSAVGVTPKTFTIKRAFLADVSATSISGSAIANSGYDITIEPTGKITNVQRGMFNTKVTDHKILTTLSDKSLTSAAIGSGGTVSISNNKVRLSGAGNTGKIFVFPTTDTDYGNSTDSITGKYLGYQTYLTKFTLNDISYGAAATGLVFNASSGTYNKAYFVEMIKAFKEIDTYEYFMAVYYYNSSGTKVVVGYSNITSTVNSIIKNFPKVLKKTQYVPVAYGQDNTTITTPFVLRVAHYSEETSLGNLSNSSDRVLRVFLNNVEITGWQIPITSLSATITTATGGSFTPSTITYNATNSFTVGDFVSISGVTPNEYNISGTIASRTSSYFTINSYVPTLSSGTGGTAKIVNVVSGTDYVTIGTNTITGFTKHLSIPTSTNPLVSPAGAYGTASKFGFYASSAPGITTGYENSSSGIIADVSELYATQTPLKQHSSNYFYQDKKFLNSVIQGQSNTELTYSMQTKPEVIGINYYDVQYTTPAAVSVDVLPIEYLWYYFPSAEIEDQKWYQTQMVDEHSLAYSTPINTGFKARMLVVNNSPHMVYLNKDSDELNQFTIRFNLWTHEIIAQSDQESIDKIVDDANSSEVAQIDSEWIQSRQAANKILASINAGLEGLSKTTSLRIYGNPLIQVGDVVTLTYPLSGINQQKYFVHSINQSFSNGLSTDLVLKTLKSGVAY